jgi:hypothetical protein
MIFLMLLKSWFKNASFYFDRAKVVEAAGSSMGGNGR